MDPAAAAQSHTYFQDTLQAVPQLLESCVSSCAGVKVIRLCCKAASTVAIQAVRTYCINLAPVPSETEPLQDVARLLQHARLQHLRVNLSILDTHPNLQGTPGESL